MSRLLLLRHAESEWNVEGRWQGWADPPLSEQGRRDAAEAGSRLGDEGFSAIAASDLQRAQQTAALAAGALGFSGDVLTEVGLREYDVGAWSGLTRRQIEAGWPEEFAEWRQGRQEAAPGGEARDAFLARLVAAVARVAATFPDQTVLVISHGGAIGTIERFLGIRPRRPVHLGGRWLDVSGTRLSAGPERLVLGTGDNAAGAANQGESTTLSQ